ncbi:ABC transporter ATP-binding protein [Vagococcus hydrophili]|uniref:ABC transporter ATP-binding protein n=1 Tax=Vagococcus hydrophili TaxID=2714947 RepID=A0A6G8AWK7_9ENTE|nr:ABC transporter ATP-binding protein [Vagococcus hydrophili]QIL49397.1 ABC transporter ATP-binding protein [Vagococcus hydrophili]
MTIINLETVSKIYQGVVPYEALKKIDLSVEEGEFLSIMGPSGSGKTTLLNIIATLDKATSGLIEIKGGDVSQLSKDELSLFRLKKIGFVFQDFNLLPPLTVEENIMLPLTLDNQPEKLMKQKVKKIMDELGISHLAKNRIHEASGGEKQRIAIARALINDPDIILADEPTGNLDSKSAGDVMSILSEINKLRNVTTIMVTHDAISASYSNRVVFIKDGCFYNEIYSGEKKELFYQNILDVLAHLGGTNHEFQATRPS